MFLKWTVSLSRDSLSQIEPKLIESQRVLGVVKTKKHNTQLKREIVDDVWFYRDFYCIKNIYIHK